jgi:DNA-binding response OmpR family regulator
MGILMDEKGLILIADDDLSCQSTTAAFLSNCGYRCDCAATGDEAISLMTRNSYDLLLSDIEMPGNQDLQLVQRVSRMQHGVPVILMTGYPTVKTAANSIGLPVAAYLTKPVDPDSLLAEVSRAVERSRCFHMIAGTRNRLATLCGNLEQIESLIPSSTGEEKNSSLMIFLNLTTQNIAGSLLDLRHLIEAAARTTEREPEMEWLQSSRPLVLIAALRETISVLAKTKGSFKSKELAELRRKLEGLLQTHPEMSHQEI